MCASEVGDYLVRDSSDGRMLVLVVNDHGMVGTGGTLPPSLQPPSLMDYTSCGMRGEEFC